MISEITLSAPSIRNSGSWSDTKHHQGAAGQECQHYGVNRYPADISILFSPYRRARPMTSHGQADRNGADEEDDGEGEADGRKLGVPSCETK
jgi:hypothetical protein